MTTVRLSGTDELLGAIAHARSVSLATYILKPGSRIVDALEAAGDRGAHVRVRVERNPVDTDDHALKRADRRAVRQLRAHHVEVTWTDKQHPSHLKAAVVDGCAFLCDRNWPDDARPDAKSPSVVLADRDPDDVAVVRAGIDGRPASDPHLWMRKDDAVRGEVRLLREDGSDAIEIESESFGTGTIAKELESQARAGRDVRLLVSEHEAANEREAKVLHRLAAAGVEVRTGGFDEKMAIVGRQAWVGSANATGWPFRQIDWGMRTRIPSLAQALHERFEAHWDHGRPLV